MNIIATDPRDDFEKVFPLPKHVIRCGNGYACTEYNAWGAYEFIHKWEGWRAAKLGDGSTAAPAVQADQLSGNNEQVSQPYTLPEHSPCADAPDHIWLQTAGEWPASGEFGELTWSCDNQHPDDTLYVRADLVGNFPCYLQGYKDGCEWSALMAEANQPQTGDWLFDDPIELAKAIRKGPDMLPAEPGNSPAIPDGYALVPIRLTAENGAKELLSGEFSETKFISCPECFGDDECETCDGSGRIEITVPVSWTTIKEIWAKGVAHFAAAPQQEAE